MCEAADLRRFFLSKGANLFMEQAKSRSSAVAPKRRLTAQSRHNNTVGYLFLTPFIIGLLVFTVYPFVYSLYLSFTEYNIVSPPQWIGIDNFVKMFRSVYKELHADRETGC